MSSPTSSSSEDIEDDRMLVQIYYRRCCNRAVTQQIRPQILATSAANGCLEASGWTDYTHAAMTCTNEEEAAEDISAFGSLYAFETFTLVCLSCLRALRESVEELWFYYDSSISHATSPESQDNQHGIGSPHTETEMSPNQPETPSANST